MRAAVCREYGPPESVVVENDWPSAELRNDQVRVRIGAAAVNFPDVLMVANKYQMTVPVPFVPGSEFAGTVVAVGSSVADLAVGDRGALLGASVTAVASSEEKLTIARSFGAAVTISHKAVRAAGSVPKITLNLVLLKGCHILGFQMRTFSANAPQERAHDERELMELLAAGKAYPCIGATFKLAEAAAALRHVADGKAIGKVVLEIS